MPPASSALGIRAGDRVGVLLLNTPDFPRAYYGALALGAAVVPIHALLTPGEIAYILRDAGVRLLVSGGPLLPNAQAGAAEAHVALFEAALPDEVPLTEMVAPDGGDDAVILYTSGTTGRPKGAVLTQSNIVLNAAVCVNDLFYVVKEDVFLAALPLFHAFGQTVVMNAAFRAGASIVLMPRFDGTAALELMRAHDVTVFAGVPTMYIALLEAAQSVKRSPCSYVLRLPAARRFHWSCSRPSSNASTCRSMKVTASPKPRRSQVSISVILDASPEPWDAAFGASSSRSSMPRSKSGSYRCPVGELGEIVIRGHCVFKGYLNNPEATRAAIVDGWFRSGDLGTMDADGFITIVDRKKDMILRGGYNVYPREVEEVLMRHPAVKQVAVVGVPHETHGEEVVAVIVRSDDAASITDEAIIVWSQEHLARYKYPRHVHFVDAMPLGPSGKVLKRELRDRLHQLQGRTVS